MKRTLIKGIGMTATIIGIAATLINDWVDEKKMDEKIEKKVNKALAKQENEKES